jgi:3-hydroxyacyl-[acyl-carrier-protein] dehydratase
VAAVTDDVNEHARLHRVLRHRHPMLLVDRVGDITVAPGGPGSTMEATKAVTAAEPCYAGLGPDDGFAYPAALLLESFLQSAAVLWARAVPVDSDATMVLGGTRRVSFPSPVYPGDLVRHRLRLDAVLGGTAFLSGASFVVGRPDLPVLVAESVAIARTALATPEGTRDVAGTR